MLYIIQIAGLVMSYAVFIYYETRKFIKTRYFRIEDTTENITMNILED